MKNLLLILVMICIWAQTTTAQSNSIAYQGRLTDSASTGSGAYLFEFRLYDQASGGTLIDTIAELPANVIGNIFTVQLNFTAPAAFDGTDRFLEIAVKRHAGDVYTTLTPRQPITAAPYALHAKNADVATNTLSVNGTPAAQIIKEGDARLTDERTPTAGSANYVQNSTTQQAATDFNISGTGAASNFNAVGGYYIGGKRIMRTPNGSILVGENIGEGGLYNAFMGNSAGTSNATGSFNSFFGTNAGYSNTSGHENAFFGRDAGFANTSAIENAFFGVQAGFETTTGIQNSFFGAVAGNRNTTGTNNSFFGLLAGTANTTGSSNTAIGARANFGANNLLFATAIGSEAVVNTSNTVVIGRAVDTVKIPGAFSMNVVNTDSHFSTGGVRMLSVNTNNISLGMDAGVSPDSLSGNIFIGPRAAQYIETGTGNVIIGQDAGKSNRAGINNILVGVTSGPNVQGSHNVFIGEGNGYFTVSGSYNTFLGPLAGFSNDGNRNTLVGAETTIGVYGLQYATAIGAGAAASQSNSISLGRADGSDKVLVFGLGTGGTTSLCLNSNNEISSCSVVTPLSKSENSEITRLQEQIKQQQSIIDALKKLVCAINAGAEVCKQ